MDKITDKERADKLRWIRYVKVDKITDKERADDIGTGRAGARLGTTFWNTRTARTQGTHQLATIPVGTHLHRAIRRPQALQVQEGVWK